MSPRSRSPLGQPIGSPRDTVSGVPSPSTRPSPTESEKDRAIRYVYKIVRTEFYTDAPTAADGTCTIRIVVPQPLSHTQIEDYNVAACRAYLQWRGWEMELTCDFNDDTDSFSNFKMDLMTGAPEPHGNDVCNVKIGFLNYRGREEDVGELVLDDNGICYMILRISFGHYRGECYWAYGKFVHEGKSLEEVVMTRDEGQALGLNMDVEWAREEQVDEGEEAEGNGG